MSHYSLLEIANNVTEYEGPEKHESIVQNVELENQIFHVDGSFYVLFRRDVAVESENVYLSLKTGSLLKIQNEQAGLVFTVGDRSNGNVAVVLKVLGYFFISPEAELGAQIVCPICNHMPGAMNNEGMKIHEYCGDILELTNQLLPEEIAKCRSCGHDYIIKLGHDGKCSEWCGRSSHRICSSCGSVMKASDKQCMDCMETNVNEINKRGYLVDCMAAMSSESYRNSVINISSSIRTHTTVNGVGSFHKNSLASSDYNNLVRYYNEGFTILDFVEATTGETFSSVVCYYEYNQDTEQFTFRRVTEEEIVNIVIQGEKIRFLYTDLSGVSKVWCAIEELSMASDYPTLVMELKSDKDLQNLWKSFIRRLLEKRGVL